MLHKVIENKAKAKRVANQLAADLRRELSIYETYKVSVESSSDLYYVQVYTDVNKSCCAILTDSCHKYVNNVIDCYNMMYFNISHHIDVKKVVIKKDLMYIPVIEIQVGYQK